MYINTTVANINISPWWFCCLTNVEETWNIQSIIQLLIGKDRQQNELCKLCSQFFYSTHHVLFECIDMKDYQIMFWKDVINNCDNLIVQEIEKMSYFA